MSSRKKTGLTFAFCISLGVHGVAYASLVGSPRETAPRAFVSEVSIEVKPLPPLAVHPAPAPAPLPPEPTPSKRPEPTPVTPRAAAPVVAATATATATATALSEPAPVLPLDLSGVTLSNDSGAGFAMPLGDGSALHGPIGLGTRAAKAPGVAPVAPPAGNGPPLVAASDLSLHPVPPALTGLLRANYPQEARERGLRGAASVRARVDADGLVRVGHVASESSPDFGGACRRTVVGSRWSAPRDKNGRAVATEIVYTCHFEVDQ